MKKERLSLTLFLVAVLVAAAVVPVSGASLNVYGHYEVKFEWKPTSRFTSSHELRLMADVAGDAFSARFRLHHTPWWQLKDIQEDAGTKLVLEEARLRWRDSLYPGAPRFDVFMGRNVWVGWDPVGLYAYEPGIGIEGLRVGNLRINALAAIKDDSNVDRFGKYMGGLQINSSYGPIDWSFLAAGNVRFDAAVDTENHNRMYLVWPAEEYDYVTLLRLQGLVGAHKTSISGFAALHSLRDKYVAGRQATAYQVDVVQQVNRDLLIEAGFRNYDPNFNPPYKKFDPGDFGGGRLDDPLEMYAGEIGGYGQVSFKARWPQGKVSDITVRLDRYIARPVPWWDPAWKGPGGEWIHPTGSEPEVTVTKARVNLDVDGYAFSAGYRLDSTPDTDSTRQRTDFSVAKGFRLTLGMLETKYELGLDKKPDSEQLAARHKVRASLQPYSERWTNLQPFVEAEYVTQGSERSGAIGLGAQYRTQGGLYIEAYQVIAEAQQRRNDSYFRLGYRAQF